MENNALVAAPAAVESTATTDTSTQTAPTTEQTQALEAQAQNGTPKQQAQAKQMLKQIKYKANGQEYSEDLPFEIPAEQAEWMQKQLSLNKGAQKSMQQYSQLEREIKDFAASMKTDTKGALQRLGIDPKQFAAMMLEEELKLQAMTPEQREREELMSKLKALEDERAKEKDEFSKKELARIEQVEYERISNKIEKAIETSGLPKEPIVVQRIAKYMLLGNELNVKFDPEELIDIVRDDIFREMQGLIRALGPDQAEKIIGKDVFNQIRKKNVAKAKTPTTPATAKAGVKDIGVTKAAPKADEPKKSYKEFFKF